MFKKSISLSAVFITLMLTSSALAANTEDIGPEIIKLKMGKKAIDFRHRKHQKATKNQCWECHDKKNGKIENWNEAKAHKICIPCHDLNEKGPVNCKGCHKK